MPTIAINAQRFSALLFRLMVSLIWTLFFLDLYINYNRLADSEIIREIFNLADEDCLGNWIASIQTFLVGLTALTIWWISRQINPANPQKGWLLIALCLCYLALDDGAGIHEAVGKYVNIDLFDGNVDSRPMPLFPSYTWQVVFLPLLGLMGASMLYFLKTSLAESRQFGSVGISMSLLALALAFDFFEGLPSGHPLNIHGHARTFFAVSDYTIIHFSRVIEEILELFAFAFLWRAFIRHLFFVLRRGTKLIIDPGAASDSAS